FARYASVAASGSKRSVRADAPAGGAPSLAAGWAAAAPASVSRHRPTPIPWIVRIRSPPPGFAAVYATRRALCSPRSGDRGAQGALRAPVTVKPHVGSRFAGQTSTALLWILS